MRLVRDAPTVKGYLPNPQNVGITENGYVFLLGFCIDPEIITPLWFCQSVDFGLEWRTHLGDSFEGTHEIVIETWFRNCRS